MKLKNFIITLALILVPMVASAQDDQRYIDDASLRIPILNIPLGTPSNLEFRVDPVRKGAVITGIGGYDLNDRTTILGAPTGAHPYGTNGKLTIPLVVGNEALNDDVIGSMLGIVGLNGTGTATIPVVGIDANAFNATKGFTDFQLLTSLAVYDTPSWWSSIDQLLTSWGDFVQGGKSGLEFVGDSAFFGCYNVKGDLDMSQCNVLTEIGISAFECVNNGFDGELTLPPNIVSIGARAFNKSKLKSNGLTFPASFNSIGDFAFNYCTNLTGTLDMSACTGLTSIGESTFDNVTGMTGSLLLPPNLQSIKTKAFNQNHFTGTLTFPATITDIQASAFNSGFGMNGDIDLSACTGLQLIGATAFANCMGFDGELKFPQSAPAFTTIGSGAFNWCNKLSNNGLVIPASVTSLGLSTDTKDSGVFAGCQGLTGDVVVEGATALNPGVFSQCSGLRSITFSSPNFNTIATVKDVNDGSFFGDTNLEFVDMSYGNLYGGAGLPFTTAQKLTPRSSATVLGGCPSHTLVYMPQYMPQFITNEPNIISNDQGVDNGSCEWLSVTDQADYFLPHGFNPSKITYDNYANTVYNVVAANDYSRVFVNDTKSGDKYSSCRTMYLPYDFNLPAGMVGYKLISYASNSSTFNGPSLLFKSVTGTLSANTPYIVRFENSTVASATMPTTGVKVPSSPVGMNHVVDGITIPSPIEVASSQVTTDGGWMFYGTTESVDNATAAGWNSYNLMPDMFWHPIWISEPTGYIGHMRGFIASKGGSSAVKLMISLGDMNTPMGIDELFGDNEPGNSVETRVYNLNGQYVGKDINALPKGMYIVNGVKTIKK